MARYDYGLRGPRDTLDPRIYQRGGSEYYGSDYSGFRGRPRRVTAPYNMDYIRERGPIYPRNANPYGGDSPGRIVGEDAYRPPYMTRAGTWTQRGSPSPPPYDYRDYGPQYGGRYPDEI